MQKPEKTNVMRVLDSLGVSYKAHYFEPTGELSGAEAARLMGADPERVFKTLVTTGASGGHYVFVIPAECSLDLKKAARSVGEKSIEMLRQKELLPLTGYIHGGCSPIGMKKPFPTRIEESAQLYDTIIFSAGKIGRQVELSPEDIGEAVNFEFADLIE